MTKRSPLLLTVLLFGYAFLYGPILSLMVYSFTESRLVTVLRGGAGFSIRWCCVLMRRGLQLQQAQIKEEQ
jgi:putrescine transport system permease protein